MAPFPASDSLIHDILTTVENQELINIPFSGFAIFGCSYDNHCMDKWSEDKTVYALILALFDILFFDFFLYTR